MKNKQQDYSQLLLAYYPTKKQPDIDIDISLAYNAKQYLPTKHKKSAKQFGLSSG